MHMLARSYIEQVIQPILPCYFATRSDIKTKSDEHNQIDVDEPFLAQAKT